MRLRRLPALLLAAAVLAGPAIGPASAAKPFVDENGSCADLTGAGANFPTPYGTVYGRADIATAPCRRGSYVMTVYTTTGDLITSASVPQALANDTGGTTLLWQADVSGVTAPVCVTLQSLDAKGNVLDDAPGGGIDGCAVGGPASDEPPAGNWH